MAKDKKGFILYADQKELFDQLPNEKAGELIKHIFSYVNDENPETDDVLLKIAFTPIKQQLKRDLKKFEDVREKRSIAGKASAESRKQKATNLTSVKSVQQTSTQSTVKENDNVNVKENDNVNDINKNAKAFANEQEFLEFFNKGREVLLGTKGKTRVMSSTDSNNFKRLNKAYTRIEFKHAIKMMSKEPWVKTASKFTISHLLAPANFDKYLNKTETLPMAQGLIEGN
jgi:hypothetical protein